MDADTIAFIAAALVGLLILAALWYGQRKRPATVTDAVADMQRAAQTAQDLVLGAQQLWVSGQMGKDDHRFAVVLNHLRYLFPNIKDEQLRIVIEAAVYLMKRAVARLDAQVNETDHSG